MFTLTRRERSAPALLPASRAAGTLGRRARKPPHLSIIRAPLRAEVRLSSRELAVAAGVSAVNLSRMVRLGLVEPMVDGPNQFTAATAARLRRMLRLRADLDVNLTGAAIIVDLVERIERLEAELARLRVSHWGA